MAKAKKATDTAPIADVAHPGTTAPSDTSKPIINQRPIMKDPMMVEDGDKTEDGAKKPLPSKTAETKITPPEEPAADETKPEADEAAKPADTDSDKDEKTDDGADKKTPKPSSGTDSDTEAAAISAQDAKMQQLIDSKKYFLPINAVEHRRSKQVVIAGIVLALILTVAWVNIALDAGLIELGGVEPVTHFFSN